MAEFKDDTLYGSSDTHMYMMEWEKALYGNLYQFTRTSR